MKALAVVAGVAVALVATAVAMVYLTDQHPDPYHVPPRGTEHLYD